MAKGKKKEKKTVKPEINFLRPIPIYELGGENDPCFGKQYDLTTDECKRCGDSELCAIASAQKLNLVRQQIELKQEFKDINNVVKTANPKELKSFITSRHKKGYTLKRITKLAIKKFKANKTEIKAIYKSIK